MAVWPTRPTQPAIPSGSVKWVVTHYTGYGKWGPKYSWLGLLCRAVAPACVCRLHAVAVRLAALISDEKRIRGVFATMRYANWQPLPFLFLYQSWFIPVLGLSHTTLLQLYSNFFSTCMRFFNLHGVYDKQRQPGLHRPNATFGALRERIKLQRPSVINASRRRKAYTS